MKNKIRKTKIQKTKIQIVSPQFEREPGAPRPVDYSEFEFRLLHTLPYETLKEIGMRAWNDPLNDSAADLKTFEGKRLMLFPGEWYSRIPESFEIVTITGVRKNFVRGRTDDDIRFGCLAYGILV